MAKRDIIAIGGSLGAIDAAKTLLGGLPADFPAAVLLVVHIGSRGANRLPEILGSASRLPVSTAIDGQILERGHVYVAPAGHHLLVMDDTIRFGRGPRENLARPAADALLRSVAVSFGPRAIGVILSGLLNDGAAGLSAIAQCGGATAVQNPSDSRASDMPLGALAAVDVDYRGTSAELAEVLVELAGQDVEPAFEVPPELELEVRIALGRRSDSSTTSEIGDVAPISCPSCGGVMSQMRTGPPLRFRCQVGHAFTAEVLAEEQEDSVDEAIRVAMRIIEERVVLLDKMAADASRAGRRFSAEDLGDRTDELRARAATLRKAAISIAD
ncbi:chemotaxis protein CheB [Mesorhizobium sp. BR1-1-16]|uniref:chemotaxis protein CheB n=1 Tax=Mesorhizobium sp. BR1-1-16 TaxID=2876653 RepID=UPI001CCDD76D|nr:chemotaxis protein CheB [Mesorhizobium sp. BR1-1-16]MBZ9936974.1 chemotaxis protein CheB [Mesorhizobium sp. BR1-1-16]